MICHTGWIPELIYNLCHYDTNLKDKNSFACRLESQKNQIMWESGLGDFFFRASPTPIPVAQQSACALPSAPLPLPGLTPDFPQASS